MWLIAVACLLLLTPMSVEVHGAARFLGHIPHDDHHLPPTTPHDHDDHTTTTQQQQQQRDHDHDADVKLPGRHYPKLPYTLVNHTPLYPLNDPNHPKPYLHPRTQTTTYDYNYDYWEEEEEEERREEYLKSPQSDTTGTSSSSPSSPPEPVDPSPRFHRDQPRSVKVPAGKTAVLVCRVLNLGDKSVSWMRHEDLHILTVDKYKYSTDRRLSVAHDEARQEWQLKIESVTQQDAGMYECQVSTKPLLSFIVSLQVVVPSAVIVNGPEIHVHRGSLINLTCVVEHTPERGPEYVMWYHYAKVIDYEEVGGVVVVSHAGPRTVSQLLVKRAEPSDSGKYTCQPSNGEAAFVMLHVLYGEHPGALQTNGGRPGGLASTQGVVTPLLTTLMLLLLRHTPC